MNHTIIRSVKGITPTSGKGCWFAENAVLVGEIMMGDHCTVWYHAVIRGDVHYIKIGDYVNVQDGAIIHCTYQKAPVNIGNRVSIGHRAIVHGCTVEDDVLIGMGAIIMDHAVIGKGSIIAAGAVVLENTQVEPGSIYAGVPAKKVKSIDEKGIETIRRIAGNYPKYAEWFKDEA